MDYNESASRGGEFAEEGGDRLAEIGGGGFT